MNEFDALQLYRNRRRQEKEELNVEFLNSQQKVVRV
jgi:hypothetical protein